MLVFCVLCIDCVSQGMCQHCSGERVPKGEMEVSVCMCCVSFMCCVCVRWKVWIRMVGSIC